MQISAPRQDAAGPAPPGLLAVDCELPLRQRHARPLVDGTSPTAQALQVKATNAADPATTFVPSEPGRAAHLAGAFSNDAVLVSSRQPVAVTDLLRSGTYAKTLTFTLSTGNP